MGFKTMEDDKIKFFRIQIESEMGYCVYKTFVIGKVLIVKLYNVEQFIKQHFSRIKNSGIKIIESLLVALEGN